MLVSLSVQNGSRHDCYYTLIFYKYYKYIKIIKRTRKKSW